MISVEIISPESSWNLLGNQLFSIEKDTFGDKAFTPETFKSHITDPSTVLAVLMDNHFIVGFAYAIPEQEDTICIVNIAIQKEYQGKKLVGILMPALELELKSKGYTYMTESAMIENGYADNIQKNYNSRIIESKDIVSEYGKQRYFKIKL